MTEKDIFSTPKDLQAFQAPLLKKVEKKGKSISSTRQTSVRSLDKIPPSVLEYFKMDPKLHRPLNKEERAFYAKVFMHEIDEGIRLLRIAHREKDAMFLEDFSHKMHLSNRLDLIRNLLETIYYGEEFSPQKIRNSHKIRNNQCGALKIRLGHHPAVAFTDVGEGYKNRNEDAFLILPTQKVIALADGIGGHTGGHIASGIAIDFFEHAIQEGLRIDKAISFANEAILLRSRNDPRLGGMHPMGCTLAAIQIKHSLLNVSHVGDTKVLLIRDGKIVFQTQDHTKGQELLNEGLVDNFTAFELNHILNRCLGLDKIQPQRDVDSQNVVLHPGDRILLLTDGITDNFFDSQFHLDPLVELVSQGSVSQAADLLVDTCQKLMSSQTLPCGRFSKPDNISLAMVEYRG